jgi:hypothetical protein
MQWCVLKRFIVVMLSLSVVRVGADEYGPSGLEFPSVCGKPLLFAAAVVCQETPDSYLRAIEARIRDENLSEEQRRRYLLALFSHALQFPEAVLQLAGGLYDMPGDVGKRLAVSARLLSISYLVLISNEVLDEIAEALRLPENRALIFEDISDPQSALTRHGRDIWRRLSQEAKRRADFRYRLGTLVYRTQNEKNLHAAEFFATVAVSLSNDSLR